MWSNILDRISFWSLFMVVVLLPVFFLPFTKVAIETSKGLVFIVGLAISVIFWALARFSDGKVVIPKSFMLLAGFGIVLAFLLSTIFSGAPKVSLFGSMLDVGSFWFIFSAFLLMLYSAIVLGNRHNAKIVLLGVMFISAVVFVFQGLRFFAPEALSFGVLGNKLGNLIGSWNALGIFAGLSVLISLFIIEFFPISKMGKWILGLLLLLSVLLVASVNFAFVWEILGIFALFIFIYKISFLSGHGHPEVEGQKKMHFPIFAFAIAMVALLFFTSGRFLGTYIPSHLGLSSSEVGPSFNATFSTTKEVLKHDPAFGMGPNMFSAAWSLYKSPQINNTLFWNVSFNVGSGLLPTFAATTGYVGILAWLVFFILFLAAGLKSLFANLRLGQNPELVVFFIAALYLFIASFFYFIGVVLFLLAFAFTGIFLGLYAGSRENGTMTISFLSDHRKSFFSLLLFIVMIIAAASLSFKYVGRFVSIFYFEKATTASAIPDAEANIKKAVSLYANDLYLRTYAEIHTIKLNSLVAKGGALTDAEKADLQTTLDQSLASATLATAFNPKNYQNFQTLGAIYSTVTSYGVPNAYEKAVEAFNTALTLNPSNPSIKMALARASLVAKKIKEAKGYANEALILKPDYIDALILLSQIARSEGNLSSAISYAEKALAVAPANQDLKNYLDSLKKPSSPSSSTNKTSKP